MMPDEKELIKNASKGDKAAFTALVRQYQNRIYAFIMRMTANRESALDLTQETFLAAYQNLAGFREEATFSTWLFTIASNKAKNFLKRAQREVAMPEDYEESSDSERPDLDFEKKQMQELLLAAVSVLPVKQRAVFNLRYFDQLKFHDIARVQGTSVSAVKTNFAEALAKLRKRLGGK